MVRPIFIFILVLVTPLLVNAEISPKSSLSDKHVQIAVYDPNQVYRISTMQGYITAIQFGEDEKIISVNIGDSAAWLVNVQNDVINLKPITDYPDTNMNVLTTRGTYQFFLTAPPPSKQEGPSKPHDRTAFLVRFHYNDAIRSHASGGASGFKKPLVENWRYTAQGDITVVPVCVYDNGRFTFFDFGERQNIPAIFSVDPRGRESLINYHIQGKFVVVETTGKQFTLRYGDQVATVFNESRS
ncbi:MAG: virB9 2 [Gammaproteobacteria bacterium]|jgi:type IV secretion system protein VirB9|nr:virB9 2 [Gammaproteobacteria bacterium]